MGEIIDDGDGLYPQPPSQPAPTTPRYPEPPDPVLDPVAYWDWYYNDPSGPGYPERHGGGLTPTPSPEPKPGIVVEPPERPPTGIVQPPTKPPEPTTGDRQSALDRLKPYEVHPGLYDINTFMESTSPKDAIETLTAAGFDRKTISKAAKENLLASTKGKAALDKELAKPVYSVIWEGMTPWDESKGETVTAGGAAVMAAEMVIPGWYSAEHWNDMDAADKALGIAIDVISLIPIVGAAGRGAKGVAVAGRGARVAGAVRGVGREVVSQLRAPVDVIIHPVATAKGMVKVGAGAVEDLIHPRKIPEAVITTADGQVMLKVSETTSPAQAMRIRDKLVELAAQGKRPVVEINGQRIELARSPLMKETKGGMAHATPDIEPLPGAKVKGFPDKPADEQGWFLAQEPPTVYTQRSAFGGGTILVPSKTSGKVVDIAKYRPNELVWLDKKPIRPLNFADAKSMPADLASKIQDYAKKEDAILYGSLNDYLKRKGAAQPNDIDLAFRDADRARADIVKICEDAGYKTKVDKHAVLIERDGEWVNIVDIASIKGHKAMRPTMPIATQEIEGMTVETLGKQFMSQAEAATEGGAKAPKRAEKTKAMASAVKKMIKESGITPRKPGIFIISPESAAQSKATGKLYHVNKDQIGLVAEMESKFAVGQRIPKVRQKLFTRIGPGQERVEIWLEKPLSKVQIAKLKGIGLVEDLRAPFKPAISIKGSGEIGVTNEVELNRVLGTLKQSGNTRQARTLTQLAASRRTAPRSLDDLAGVPERMAPEATERPKALPKARATEPVRATPSRRLERASKPERPERIRAEKDRPERARSERQPGDRARPSRERPERPGRERPRGRPVRERPRPPRPRRPRPQTPERSRQRIPDRPRPRIPERPRPDHPHPPRPRFGPETEGKPTERDNFPKGSVAWKQGIGWWVIKPPYNREQDRLFTTAKPSGAIITADAKSAAGTIQSIGGNAPVNTRFDMGIVDVSLKPPPATPRRDVGKQAITFKRDRDQTYGGRRGRKVGPYYYKGGAMSRRPLD